MRGLILAVLVCGGVMVWGCGKSAGTAEVVPAGAGTTNAGAAVNTGGAGGAAFDGTIGKDRVAMIDYTLTDDKGEVLDSSKGRAPLPYIAGHHNLIPGLEAQLEGKKKGDHFVAVIAAKDAYGERDEKLVQTLPRDKFPADMNLQPGMHLESSMGQRVLVTKVDEKGVTIDANHPLAGQTLHFDVTVVEVRAGTEKEIAAGRVLGG